MQSWFESNIAVPLRKISPEILQNIELQTDTVASLHAKTLYENAAKECNFNLFQVTAVLMDYNFASRLLEIKDMISSALTKENEHEVLIHMVASFHDFESFVRLPLPQAEFRACLVKIIQSTEEFNPLTSLIVHNLNQQKLAFNREKESIKPCLEIAHFAKLSQEEKLALQQRVQQSKARQIEINQWESSFNAKQRQLAVVCDKILNCINTSYVHGMPLDKEKVVADIESSLMAELSEHIVFADFVKNIVSSQLETAGNTWLANVALLRTTIENATIKALKKMLFKYMWERVRGHPPSRFVGGSASANATEEE